MGNAFICAGLTVKPNIERRLSQRTIQATNSNIITPHKINSPLIHLENLQGKWINSDMHELVVKNDEILFFHTNHIYKIFEHENYFEINSWKLLKNSKNITWNLNDECIHWRKSLKEMSDHHKVQEIKLPLEKKLSQFEDLIEEDDELESPLIFGGDVFRSPIAKSSADAESDSDSDVEVEDDPFQKTEEVITIPLDGSDSAFESHIMHNSTSNKSSETTAAEVIKNGQHKHLLSPQTRTRAMSKFDHKIYSYQQSESSLIHSLIGEIEEECFGSVKIEDMDKSSGI